MSRNPTIALSFSSSKFQQELKAMDAGLKATKKEFEITNLSIQATGSQLDVAKNKLQGYARQAEIQRAITNKVREAIEAATRAQTQQAQRVEAARAALERATRAEGTSQEELVRLRTELERASNTYDRLGRNIAQWNDRLLNSRRAEEQIRVAVRQTNDSLERQNRELTENIKNTRNVTSATGQLINAYTILKAMALGYAGKTLYNALIGGNAQFEQYMTSFEVLLGGADKAQKRMGELTQFAAVTPFELPQVVEAEKRLLAYGVAAKDTAKTLQILGDISMGNNDKLNLISLAYGQVVTNQRLYGTELRQFAENGVPLLDELAKVYGKTTAEMRKMVEDGQIGADSVTFALENLTLKGGKFYGMMEKQSKTMIGMWSTLKDNIRMFAREVGEESFENIKKELGSFMDTLNEMSKSGELSEIASEVGENIAKFVEFVIDAVKALWDMKETLIKVGEALIAFKITMSIAGVITSVITAISTYTKAIKEAQGVTMAFTAALSVNPWVLLGSVIATVTLGIIGYKIATRESKEETLESIKAKKEEITETDNLINQYETLKSKTNLTATEKANLHEIEKKLAELYPTAADGIDAENQKYTTQIDLVKQLNAEKRTAYEQDLELMAAEGKSKISGLNADFESSQKERDNLVKERDKLKSQFAKDKALYDKIMQENAKGRTWVDITNDDEIFKQVLKAGYSSATIFVTEMESKLQEWDSINDKLTKIDEKRAKIKEDIYKYNNAIQQTEVLQNPEAYDFSDAYKYMQSQKEKQQVSGERKPPKLRGSDEDEAKKRQKALEEEYKNRTELSEAWINQQKKLGKLSSDEEIAAYKRIEAYTAQYYKKGALDYSDYSKKRIELENSILDAEREAFQKRRELSNEWIQDQKNKGYLSANDEIAAYERVRKYTEEYYKKGIIAKEEYSKQIREIDNSEFEVRKKYLEDNIKASYEADKKMLDSKKKAIEDEYDLLELNEKRQDRAEKLSELTKTEELYRGAVTKEGKERYKEIQDKIKDLNKEATKEARELEKKDRLAALQKEYDNLDEKQKSLLENVNKYAALTADTLERVSERIAAIINALSGAFPILGLATNQTNYNIHQTNNNTITDSTSANIFGNYLMDGIAKLSGVK